MLLGANALTSCADQNDWSIDETFARLFSTDGSKIKVTPSDVTAEVEFNTVKNADYYIIEVSTSEMDDDTEMGANNSIVYGEDKSITTSPATIDNLIGDTKYYLRIKAKSETTKDSRWSYYNDGSTFKTKAEQIFNEVAASDRSENSIRVTWDATKDVSNLILQDAEGNELQNITLDEAAKNAGEYTFTDLTASTNYKITIMLGESKRGELSVSTTAAMPSGDYKTELAPSITTISNALLKQLVDEAKTTTGKTSPAITIGLQPNTTYTVVSQSETDGTDANTAIPEGISITFFGLSGGNAPTLKWKKCLDLAGAHSYIRFQNVSIEDDGCNYFINQSNECNVGELSFTDCNIKDFKNSLVRTQGSKAISIDKIMLDNCICTNMGNTNAYSFFYLGTASHQIGKIDLKNSTFDGTGKSFIETKATISNGVTITSCTFYNNVQSGKYFMDANGLNVNITFSNTILGKSQDAASRGIRTKGNISIDNSLRTADCVYGSNDIKEFSKDSRSSADIFTDPENHNFTLQIPQHYGDPRWYMSE